MSTLTVTACTITRFVIVVVIRVFLTMAIRIIKDVGFATTILVGIVCIKVV